MTRYTKVVTCGQIASSGEEKIVVWSLLLLHAYQELPTTVDGISWVRGSLLSAIQLGIDDSQWKEQ